MNGDGIKLDSIGEWLTRSMGSAFVSIGILNWSARKAKNGTSRAILLSDMIFASLGFFVTLLARLSGLGNGLMWITIAAYLFMTIGFVYYAFVQTNKT